MGVLELPDPSKLTVSGRSVVASNRSPCRPCRAVWLFFDGSAHMSRDVLEEADRLALTVSGRLTWSQNGRLLASFGLLGRPCHAVWRFMPSANQRQGASSKAMAAAPKGQTAGHGRPRSCQGWPQAGRCFALSWVRNRPCRAVWHFFDGSASHRCRWTSPSSQTGRQ